MTRGLEYISILARGETLNCRQYAEKSPRQTESSQTAGMEFHLIRIIFALSGFFKIRLVKISRINQRINLSLAGEKKQGVGIGNPGKHIAHKEQTHRPQRTDGVIGNLSICGEPNKVKREKEREIVFLQRSRSVKWSRARLWYSMHSSPVFSSPHTHTFSTTSFLSRLINWGLNHLTRKLCFVL